MVQKIDKRQKERKKEKASKDVNQQHVNKKPWERTRQKKPKRRKARHLADMQRLKETKSED